MNSFDPATKTSDSEATPSASTSSPAPPGIDTAPNGPFPSTSSASTSRPSTPAFLNSFASSTSPLSIFAASGSNALRGSKSPFLPPSPQSPVRFAATTDAFGLHHHESPSSPTSPPSATPARRLRRPSLLSLSTEPRNEQGVAEAPEVTKVTEVAEVPETDAGEPTTADMSLPTTTVHPQPTQRWGVSPLSPLTAIAPSRVGSAPPIAFEGLSTASPIMSRSGSALDDERPAWSELRRGSGKIGGEELAAAPRLPFPGRPLPGPLLATLISESAPLEHEMRSEARYQRLISSHPSVFPLTPRQRRNTRWTRGRFPEMVGDDEEEEEDARQLGSRWLAGSSDTDSDDMMDDPPEWQSSMSGAAGAVNSAFASVMDLDRPASSGSNSAWASASGKSTPGGKNAAAATPPPQWKKGVNVNSPASGLQLPTAFGSLAMGGVTPLGSPTVEKMELACSPTVGTPGMMQYREPTSGRPGKRKAVDDRFDPYKRPRGSSPSPFAGTALSPSKSSAIPIPSSPSHLPLVGSALAMGSPGYLNLNGNRPKTSTHRSSYARPMARSRAASPALSIGSTSGVLSSSLGSGVNGTRPLAGPFIPTGHGAAAAVTAANTPGAAPSSLGSMGFLSLSREGLREEEGEETEDAMEED